MSDDVTVVKSLGVFVETLAGSGCTPAKGNDEKTNVRVFYVGANRITREPAIATTSELVFAVGLQ